MRLLAFLLRWVAGDRGRAETLLGDLVEDNRRRRSGWTRYLATAHAVATVVGALFVERCRRVVSPGRGPGRPGPDRETGARTLLQEVTGAAVRLRRAPGFALAAAATVALGVGVITAIFSVVHTVMLRPLPYPDAGRVVKVWPNSWMTKGWVMTMQRAESLQAVSAYQWGVATLTGRGRPVLVDGASVFGPHFAVVGVLPEHGRAFRAEDHEPGAEATVILSHRLWSERFAADPGLVGQLIDLSDSEGSQRRVVGIMPRGYQPIMGIWDFWVPTRVNPDVDYPGSQLDCTCRAMVGRVAPGVTLERASAEVALLGEEIQAGAPERVSRDQLVDARVVPLLQHVVAPYRGPLGLVFGASALVLLIACVNVANLLLVRGQQRVHELALRRALGASQRRLTLQLLCESLLVGLGGGALGLPVALLALGYFRSALADVLPRAEVLRLDTGSFGFAILIGLLASLVFGSWPALRLPRLGGASDPGGVARRASPTGAGAQRLLIVAEVALAVVLVIGAGLLLRSLRALVAEDPGFDPRGLVTVGVMASGERYTDAGALTAFHTEVLDRVAALPGVVAVGSIQSLPFGTANWGWSYTLAGEEPGAGETMPNAGFRIISDGYLEALGVEVVAGRSFSRSDQDGAAEVALVNEAFARRHFESPGEAIGRTITLNTGATFQIVGVVTGIRQRGYAEESPPAMFRPQQQFPAQGFHLLARVADGVDPGLGDVIRETVWAVDPDVPATAPQNMQEIMSRSVGGPRLYRDLLGAFAALGLLLAAVGVYAVVAYVVSRSRRGIAIRMAVGATGRSVRGTTLRQALAPVVIGAALGVAAAAAGSRLLASQLYGIEPTDVTTFVAVPLVVLLVAAIASYGPASRASRLDPASTLRAE